MGIMCVVFCVDVFSCIGLGYLLCCLLLVYVLVCCGVELLFLICVSDIDVVVCVCQVGFVVYLLLLLVVYVLGCLVDVKVDVQICIDVLVDVLLVWVVVDYYGFDVMWYEVLCVVLSCYIVVIDDLVDWLLVVDVLIDYNFVFDGMYVQCYGFVLKCELCWFCGLCYVLLGFVYVDLFEFIV